MSDVRLAQLDKIYPASGKTPAFHAVKGINLEIQEKEFMVLVGPSGCGKSTTLRMIAGLEDITAGEISIGNRVVNNVEPKNRDIAMVFQNYALYPHMTVYDNMAFGLKLRKAPRREIEKRVLEAATTLGIESMLDRKPKALSGGQRQRVAVGRAIVRNPQVFLFDEPLSNLDAKMRVSMRNEISRLHAKLGATMIYVTHDQVEAMTMGDRICVMNDGRIMQVDTPTALYDNPKNMFVAGFIGSPPMNFVRGRIEKSADSLSFIQDGGPGGISVTLDAELAQRAESRVGQPIVFGIRPEAILVLDGQSQSTQENGYSAAQELSVEMSEPHGAETMLYAQASNHSLVARIRGAKRWLRGQTVEVAFDLRQAKLFDPKTEEVIAEKAGPA